MNAIDRYVDDVMHRIAPGFPGRSRIEVDLRNHLAERVAAGEDPDWAIERMGPPAEVAGGFLESFEPPLAGRGERLGAFLFDVGLGGVAIGALALLAVAGLGPHIERPELPLPLFVALAITATIVFVLVILYFPVLEALFGQTAGKRAFGIFVARDTGERIGLVPAVVRRIPFLFDIWPIDAAFLLFTERRQRAFDFAARTIVIGGGRRIRRAWVVTGLLWVLAAGLGTVAALLGSP